MWARENVPLWLPVRLPPPQELLSISWDLQTKIINRSNFYTVFCRNQVSPGILVIFKMVRVSPHLVGSHEMGRCSHVGDGVWSGNFKMVRASLHFSSSHGIPLDLSRPNPLHKISPQDMPMLTLYGFHGGNEYSESWKLRCYMTTMRLTYMVEAGTQINRTIYHWARLQFWLKIKLKAGLQAWGINLVLLNTDIHSIIVLLIGEGPNPIT